MLESVLLQPLLGNERDCGGASFLSTHLPPSPSSSTVVIYSIVIVRTQLRLGPLADQKDEKEKSFINATVVIGSQTPLQVYISEYLPSRLNPLKFTLFHQCHVVRMITTSPAYSILIHHREGN